MSKAPNLAAEAQTLTVTQSFINFGDIKVPALIASREVVLCYFKMAEQLAELENKTLRPDSDDFHAHKELKARTARLEKSMYYACEVTGELRLLSSLTLLDDRIVSNSEYRRVYKERRKLKVQASQA